MKVRATLEVALRPPGPRRALLDVLAPDNEGLPHDLVFSVTRGSGSVSFNAESESPSAALSTVLSLLRDVVLFQEVWLLSSEKDTDARVVKSE